MEKVSTRRMKIIRDNDGDMPRGNLKRIKDFLPLPEKLNMPQCTAKVTVNKKLIQKNRCRPVEKNSDNKSCE